MLVFLTIRPQQWIALVKKKVTNTIFEKKRGNRRELTWLTLILMEDTESDLRDESEDFSPCAEAG
jgi:hypothetical protein